VLLVTPPPSVEHERIVAWLTTRIVPFVVANGIGAVQYPRSVVVIDGSQTEPDMMVRPTAKFTSWEDAPLPLLVIEVVSKSTRRRDLDAKRAFYIESGIDEYWAIDRYERTVFRFTRMGKESISTVLSWTPAGALAPLELDVGAMFDEASPVWGQQ
jgi:Uma2 family endonuclease